MDATYTRYSIMSLTMMGLSLILNSAIVLTNISFLHKLPSSSFLIVFLCFGDSLTTSNVVALTMTHLIKGSLDYDAQTCQIQAVFITFGALLSLGLCGGLTLFRYLVIVQGIDVSKKFAVYYLAGISAFFAAFCSLPFMLGSQQASYAMHPSGINCTGVWHSRDPRAMILTVLCPIFLVMVLFGIVYAYYRIYQTISSTYDAFKSVGVISNRGLAETSNSSLKNLNLSSSQLNRPALLEGSALNRATLTPDLEAFSKAPHRGGFANASRGLEEAKQLRLLVQTVMVVTVFVVGWTPYFVFMMMELVSGTPAPTVFEFAADIFVAIADFVNPIVVLVFDKEIRTNLAIDLLNPLESSEKRSHKLKRLVQSPNSFFMDVKCPGCFQITTVFSHAQTVVQCSGCATILSQPTGGKARLTEGCSFRRKQN
ncbi:hypothetical protein CcCBS67573_g08960 [Chytriomyces confervae]|uniref:40S ribosomal protein S27 n=2 Tax=Chytriomyces confervae TaxID=246404 RepID=A0A507EAT5_9FUNG|nr:hypothetical protein CcCBS67573_g08960 [Chytriomyces confervae]